MEACLSQSPGFAKADQLLSRPGAITSAHALAEAYATLSGSPRLKIKPEDAARMVDDIADLVTVLSLETAHYRKLITTAPIKGIRGGLLYDALHAETARTAECQEIYTLNVSHFKQVAPDLKVMGL